VLLIGALVEAASWCAAMRMPLVSPHSSFSSSAICAPCMPSDLKACTCGASLTFICSFYMALAWKLSRVVKRRRTR
jgi:hypothetical protein